MQMAQRLASGMFDLLSRADTMLTDYTRAQRAERRLAARWAGVKPSDARIYTFGGKFPMGSRGQAILSPEM